METTTHTSNTLAWTLAALIGVSIAGGIYWQNNRTLTKRYDQSEQRADSLLSVKFVLESDIQDLKTQLETVTDDNAYLDGRIERLHEQIVQRDHSVITLRRSRVKQLQINRNLSDSLSQLATIRDSLENQLVAMHDKINWQNQSNALLLKGKNELEKTQQALNTRVQTMVARSAITGDAFRIDVSKSNKKVTAKAKKAARLTISLNVPASLNLAGQQELYLSITDRQQHPMIPSVRNTTIALPTINEIIPVHAEQLVDFAHNPQRISFSLTPDTAIKPGTYRASVFTKDAYLGSVEFRLRDSFWFF